MKKIYFVIAIFILANFTFVTIAQEDQDLTKKDTKENVVLDTRIDNMGYWMKKAEEGHIPYTQPIPVKPAKYKGSILNGDDLKAVDSPDVPVTSATNVTESENSIFVDPNDNQYVLNSNNSTSWSGGSVGTLYGANYFQTANGGTTWGGSASGAGGNNSGDPTTAINHAGRQFVNYISSSSGQGLSYSDNGTSWTAVTIAPNPGSLADKNHMWIDNSLSSSYVGNLYTAWTPFGGSDDAEIVISRSTNNGVSWSSPPLNISSAVSAGSHNQGVHIQTGPNGDVYAVWTIYDSWPSDETALGFAKSTNGGVSYGAASRIISNINGIRTTETNKNHRVNSFPVMAVDISGGANNGNMYVVWSNYGDPNNGNSGSNISVYMIRSTNGGTSWSNPIRVNQGPFTNDYEAYFPWITCDPETGIIAVVYYDDRDIDVTPPINYPVSSTETWVAYSLDAGNTWTDMRVSDVSFTPSAIPGLAGGYMGDYLAITSKGARFYPCWTDNRGGLYMTYVSPFELGLNAAFSADITDVCSGGTVTFTDNSTGSPTSWNWSFPGGTPSSATGAGPHSITYNTPGSYNVSLIVGDGVGTDTETIPGYINVQNIIADFSGSPTTVVAGNTVTFTDNSACSPTSWSWSFPGGTPATASGIGPHTITYNTIGTYGVSLTVANASYNDTETKTNYIDVINCNYCTTSYSNTSDDYISNVSFNTINNPSGSTTYSDFTAISTNITTGNNYNISADITVNGSWTQHCWAWIDWNRDCDFDDAGEGFDLGQTPGTSGTHTLSVNIPVPAGASLGSTRMRVSELYAADPTPCTVSTYGEAEDYTVVIQSSASPPIADFTADDTTPAVGQTVNFTDMTANSPTSWSWSFNPTTIAFVGGTNSSSQNPQAQFNTAGYYTVTLIATNGFGSDPETKTNYILAGTAGNWTGNTNTNWNLNTNWENLLVPTSIDNVTIPASAPNWPTYTGDFELGTQCLDVTMEGSSEMTVTGNMVIASGRSFSCNGNNILNVGGQWTDNGSFTPGTGTVNFYGTTASDISAGGSALGGGKFDNAGGGGYYTSATYIIFDSYSAFDLISAKVYANGAGNRTFYWSNSSGTIQQQATINVPDGESRVTLNFNITPGTNHRLGVSGTPNLYRNNSSVLYPYAIGTVGSVTSSNAGSAYYYFYYDMEYSTGAGAETYNHLIISKTNAEVTTNADVNVQGNLTVNSQSQLTNSSGYTLDITGDAYFYSDANGMASFLDYGTTTITGVASYQQYLTSERWHLVSPPVAGSAIGVYMDIYLKEYLEPTDSWNYLVQPTTMPMNVGQGYAAWASDDLTGTTTVTYTGTITNNNLTINSLDYTPGAAKEGFNLIGNPYPCAIDWNSSWSLSDLSGWMVVYDNGTYKGIHSDGTPYNGKTDGIIPPSQGFWVRATSGSASVTIPAAERLHSGQAFYKEAKDNIYPIVRLETEINGFSDEAAVIFHPESTVEYDGYYDLVKFENVQEAPQLFTISQGENYAINYFGEEYVDKIIPIGFKTLEAGLYTLHATDVSNFDIATSVYLEDIKTGSVTELQVNPTYSFEYETEDDEHRFNLYFTGTTGLDELRDNSIQISSFQNKVFIKNPALLEGNIVIYNMLGQKIVSTNTNRQEFIEIPVSQGLGYYFVNVISDSFIKSEKVLIK